MIKFVIKFVYWFEKMTNLTSSSNWMLWYDLLLVWLLGVNQNRELILYCSAHFLLPAFLLLLLGTRRGLGTDLVLLHTKPDRNNTSLSLGVPPHLLLHWSSERTSPGFIPAATHFLYRQAWQDLLLARLTSHNPVPDLQVYFVTWNNTI